MADEMTKTKRTLAALRGQDVTRAAKCFLEFYGTRCTKKWKAAERWDEVSER